MSQLVRTYCANGITTYHTSAKTETLSVNWASNIVQLTESPLVGVTSVKERENLSDSYTTLVENTDYYVDYSTDSIYRVSSSGSARNWANGPGAVQVVYNAGYENCPADLELAVIDLITYYVKDEHKARQTIAGASIQNQSSSSQRNNVAFPDHIKRVLDLYKNF
ncbi:hypothetical protein N9R80_00230 [bacterium]|nr:hypothetical protein [bacterium]